jgi:hypothetical protein
MSILIIVLRAMHILGGIFWTGGAITLAAFVLPSANATRPESGRFMQHLTGPAKLPLWMLIASWATVIGGVGLFGPVTGQLNAEIMRTPRGIALSLGALIAIGSFLEGLIVTAPTARKLGALGAAIAAAGAPPTPEQVQQIQAVQTRLQRAGARAAIMLSVTALLMSIARYL